MSSPTSPPPPEPSPMPPPATPTPDPGPTQPAAGETPPAVSLRSVSRLYRATPTTAERWALRDVDLDIARGELTAIMGPSGSGKSTLLHCAAGLDRPTQGTVHLGATDLTDAKEHDLTQLRRRRIGFVFQAYNLVPSLTVTENLELPFRVAGDRVDTAWIGEVIARVGLAEHATHLPSELSGGQQQRAAIARAVVTRPDVVLADEPTGALDRASGRAVLDLLGEVVRAAGQTVVVVTHDPVVAGAADRVVLLGDGRIVSDLRRPSAATLARHLAAAEPTAVSTAGAP